MNPALPLAHPTTRLLSVLFVAALLVAGGSWLWWHGQADARRWTRLRPAVPTAAGDSAPGLDARLGDCAAKFARWPADEAALAEFALLCHANGLLPEAIRGYEALVALQPAEARWPHLLRGCSFDVMKEDARTAKEGMSFAWKGGPETFFFKGTNGRWRDVLTRADLELYEQAMRRTLPNDCARWLENGGRIE